MPDLPLRRLPAAPLRSCLAFLAALAAVSIAISHQLPSLPVVEISTKLDYLRARRGEIDTVFLGSSRVYHAFDPQQFDRELAARGVTARSFNLGVDGLRPPESFYVARELLKLRLPLRSLLIELGDIQPKVNAANLGTARYVHWHDWRHTRLVLAHLAQSSRPAGERLLQAAVHLGCFAARASNIGRGQDWLAALLRGPQKYGELPVPWKNRGGFEAQDTPRLAGAARAGYEDAVAVISRDGIAKTPIPPVLAGALRELVAEIRAAGVRPIFVISPTVAGRENLVALAQAGLDVPVIAFTDPRRYPALFRAENHCDVQHLNSTGAAEFTRTLAEEWAAMLEGAAASKGGQD